MELNIKGASKDEILKKLFLSTLYLSAFTFGGGYAMIPLIKRKPWKYTDGLPMRIF